MYNVIRYLKKKDLNLSDSDKTKWGHLNENDGTYSLNNFWQHLSTNSRPRSVIPKLATYLSLLIYGYMGFVDYILVSFTVKTKT